MIGATVGIVLAVVCALVIVTWAIWIARIRRQRRRSEGRRPILRSMARGNYKTKFKVIKFIIIFVFAVL